MIISVVTVCYNSAKTLEDTILSVLSQTDVVVEHVIIDGGSSDGTHQIIDKYSDQLSKVVIEIDEGIFDAMNKGISLCSGDLVCLLNSDDVFFDNLVLKKIQDEFVKAPQIDAVLSSVVQERNGQPTRFLSCRSFKPWKMRFGFNPPHPGVFYRRSVYQKLGGFERTYRIAADYEFMVRTLYKKQVRYALTNFVSVRMKEGGASTSGITSTHIISQEIVQSCRKNDIYTNYLVVLFRLPIKWVFQKKTLFDRQGDRIGILANLK